MPKLKQLNPRLRRSTEYIVCYYHLLNQILDESLFNEFDTIFSITMSCLVFVAELRKYRNIPKISPSMSKPLQI